MTVENAQSCNGKVGRVWDNGRTRKDGPGVGALTPTESPGLDQQPVREDVLAVASIVPPPTPPVTTRRGGV